MHKSSTVHGIQALLNTRAFTSWFYRPNLLFTVWLSDLYGHALDYNCISARAEESVLLLFLN